MTQLKRIADQTIVITGASSGIGLVTARKAAALGAKVVLVARSEGALSQIVNELTQAGHRAIYVVADVSRIDDLKQVVVAAENSFGGFDTWVNNAAVTIYGKLADVRLEDHRRLFETNYWGVVQGSMIAAEHLKERGGAIINIGSVLSDRAIPLQGGYCATKHAVKAFTESLRMELEKDELPISITLIKPAAIDTPYTQHAKNYMDVEPNHPSPVYSPTLVADAILHCAEHPVRDLFVGGGAAGLSVGGFLAPQLTDVVMEKMMFEAQRSDKPARHDRESLYRPSNDPRESGVYDGHVAKSSLYTSAAKRPWLTRALVIGGAAVAYQLIKSSHKQSRTNGDAAAASATAEQN